MISSIITQPQPGDTLTSDTSFNVSVQTTHLAAGNFVNPTTSYYTAPQDLDSNGDIIGHCHVTIQDIGSLQATTPPDPTKFAFFKGIDDAGNGRGLLQAVVQGGLPPGVYRTANKAETAGDFLEWLGTAAAATLIVYSDGSQLPNGAVGFGFAVHRDKQSLVQGSGRLGPSEVFDAEATGAIEGLRAALRLGDTRSAVVVCTDNLAVASCLRGNPADSSQDKFTKFQELATSHGNVQVHWIPGHTNIPGNEEADGLAKAGCLQPEPPEAMPSLAHLRRLARQQSRDAFKAWWSTEAPGPYKTLNLEATTSCPPELALPRATLHSLLAARSRHGDFADYHERFNHDDARLDCSCGRRKAPEHPFYCRKVPPRLRMRLAPSPAEAIHHAVGKGFKAFVEMTSESSFFQRICPRH
ncbi:endonuclease/exonuclease/phosphatase [Purpureocillium lilacinum]|uniref:Endonuclease/exonuclease/phosphatase n=1 Tax=Purpureocillium lilacinum TaxID=33203 RepID=A0A179FJU8_PURLI|nr:endonuclease/exonuclease/phosphatase [Purpureocillium lilacinum]OAQ65608.1 endonuclease/exonuclease/phosphatase [Purpureocillium lilacinum]